MYAFTWYSLLMGDPLSLQQPTRQIFVGNGAPGQVIYPTCHDHHPSPDNMDLVVGLNTGDGEHFACHCFSRLFIPLATTRGSNRQH